MTRSGSDTGAQPGPFMELFGCSGGAGVPALRDLSQQAVAHALARALAHIPGHAPASTAAGGASGGVTGDATGDAPWPLAVDGTAGNGHDTLFLARLVGARGLVHAFDVQPRALARTAERLAAVGLEERVALHGRGHEELAAALASRGTWPPRITAAMFNLGFLPGSDRSVTTRPATTLTALEALLPLMVPGGVVSLHVYAGHPGGGDEAAALDRRLAELDWNLWRVARYEFANKPRNPERLLLVLRLPDPA
ncbi:tRNA (mnm(5)s(2)U34)-methyltransferase [Nitratidesulfovibrio liaohensis]|uniref:tRNA (mnm(5)s(2)U34)-methyltransferase n=1 Tax=Nitratidesulfovibrio liaohensis TaxID=2604158 RepID=UPI00141F3ADB|nr:class I SAM-dependent methyltransferase [Nitratidesulfovibrio liaohensis]NHZ47387.1 rRNA methyltransferase [Nitratidesulfovibrio liaohensis]